MQKQKVSVFSKKGSESKLDTVSESRPITVEWEPLGPIGPRLAFHVGCLIRGSLYIHGGVREKDGKQPSSDLYRMDVTSGTWSEIRTSGSPALSHHCAVTIENRYMLLIGGWNGHLRTSLVHTYDVQEDRWLPMATFGFPEGGGLSSHTANLLKSGKILVIGRDGSLRTQRRHGNVYLLSGNVCTGQFHYSEYSTGVSSRSGHTASFIGSKLYIVGGRSDHLLEVAPGFSNGSYNKCGIMETLSEAAKCKRLCGLYKMPCGRKNHIAVPGPGVLFVHGGETFDGRSRDPVGEMLLLLFSPAPEFFTLGESRLGRAGHVCCTTDDAVIMHGGVGTKSQVFGDAYQLKIQS